MDPHSAFVYQMGKVASNSVVRWLENCPLVSETHHAHFISDPALAYLERWRIAGSRRGDTLIQYVSALEKQIQLGKQSKDALALGMLSENHHPLIISGIREPVDYAVSGFFQSIFLVSPVVDQLYELNNSFVSVLKDLFICRFEAYFSGERPRNSFEAHCHLLFHCALRWFDWDFTPATGLKIFDQTFDHHSGWQYREYQNCRVLFYRYEGCATILPHALSFATGCELSTMAVENASENKPYAALYDDFLETLVLPSSLLDQIYLVRQVSHFYTPEEIANFRMRWSGNMAI